MDRHSSSSSPPSPHADPDSVKGTRPLKWSMLWGIISIIWGVGGLFLQGGKCYQSYAYLRMTVEEYSEALAVSQRQAVTDAGKNGLSVKSVPDYGNDPKVHARWLASAQKLAPQSIATALALAIVALILIRGGLLLCKRKRGASITLQLWAVLKIIAAGFAGWVSYLTVKSVSDGQSDVTSVEATTLETAAIGVTVVSFTWALLLPIYFFYQLNRSEVKEEMRREFVD